MPKRRQNTPAMDPSELEAQCTVLYGQKRWQTALAEELQVNDRTVRRWVAGEAPIPHTAALTIRLMAFLDELSWLGEWRKMIDETQ